MCVRVFLTGRGCFVEGTDWRVQPTAAGVWGATATVPPGAGTTGGVRSGGSRGFVTDFKPPSTPIPPETTIIPSENQISRPNMCYDFQKLPGTSPDNLCLSENESSPVLYPDYQQGCGSLLLLVMEMQYLQHPPPPPQPPSLLSLFAFVACGACISGFLLHEMVNGLWWWDEWKYMLVVFVYFCSSAGTWRFIQSWMRFYASVFLLHARKGRKKEEGVVACLLSKQLHVTSVWGFELLRHNRLLLLSCCGQVSTLQLNNMPHHWSTHVWLVVWMTVAVPGATVKMWRMHITKLRTVCII